MTCIVGLIADGTTYIGSDSLGSDGYSKTVRRDPKTFKLKDTGNAIIGYTSSYRMGQLLMYAKGLIDSRDEPNINHEYLVTKFIPNIISLFETNGFAKNDSGEKSGGTFLLGYKDKLFSIQDDYQVAESSHTYEACGSGESYALGSLKTTEGLDLSPLKRIELALKAASTFSTTVAAPYQIINTSDDKIVIINN